MTKLASFLLATAICAAPFTVFAEEPDLGQLQQLLVAEQQKLAELAKLADKAVANQQQIQALEQKNRQLSAEVAALHEQLQVAEGKAANAEAERDRLKGQIAAAATAAETARQALLQAVSGIKGINDAASEVPQEATPEFKPEAPAPTPPASSTPTKRQVAKPTAKAEAPIAKTPLPPPASQEGNTDERAVLGGRPAALSFANLEPEKRQEVRQLLKDLGGEMDERGLFFVIPADTLFAPISDRLRPTARYTLGKVAEVIKASGKQQVLIVGHGDGTGAASYDQSLSERRAKAVKQYLVGAGGIRPNILTAQGVGDASPIAANSMPEANRRIEVIIQN